MPSSVKLVSTSPERWISLQYEKMSPRKLFLIPGEIGLPASSSMYALINGESRPSSLVPTLFWSSCHVDCLKKLILSLMLLRGGRADGMVPADEMAGRDRTCSAILRTSSFVSMKYVRVFCEIPSRLCAFGLESIDFFTQSNQFSFDGVRVVR